MIAADARDFGSRFAVWRAVVIMLVAALSNVGCGRYPKDPRGTLERIENERVVRAGAMHNPPWVDIKSREPSGLEVRLVEALASELRARVVWKEEGGDHLLRELEEFELDVVVAGLVKDTPWKSHVALSTEYREVGGEKHVFALPPGENAWQLHVERFLRSAPAQEIIEGQRP